MPIIDFLYLLLTFFLAAPQRRHFHRSISSRRVAAAGIGS